MNIQYKQIGYSPELNEELTITIEPVRNMGSSPVIVELPKECIVIQNLIFLEWEANRPLGISQPLRANISIDFATLQKDKTAITVSQQKYLFDNILDPYIPTIRYEGTENEYSSYKSNKITIQSQTLGKIILIQDVYSEISVDRKKTDISISCIDQTSWLLKSCSLHNDLLDLLLNIEKWEQGVYWDKSKFAFDYICTKDSFFKMHPVVKNASYKPSAPLGVFIGGTLQLSGASPENTPRNNIRMEGLDGDLGAETLAHSHLARTRWGNILYIKGVGDKYNYQGVNGFNSVYFANIKTFHLLLGLILFRYHIETDELITMPEKLFYLDGFHKQKYDGSIKSGENIDDGWFIYKIKGAGTLSNFKDDQVHLEISGTLTDDEIYFDERDAIAGLNNYPTVYDFLVDALKSELKSFVISSNEIKEYKRPENIIELDLTKEPCIKNIEFTYSNVNINTGRVSPEKDTSTATVITAPGTADNVNIASIFNTYPVSLSNAVRQAFIVNNIEWNDPHRVINGLECYFAPNDAKDTVDFKVQKINMGGVYSGVVDYGNAGYYSQTASRNANSPTDMQNLARNWIAYARLPMQHGADFLQVEVGKSYSKGFISRRPTDMVNSNTSKLSIFKVFYKETYANTEQENDSGLSDFKALHPNDNVFISAIPNLSEFDFSLTDFDWRVPISPMYSLDYVFDEVIFNNICTHQDTFDFFVNKYAMYKERVDALFDSQYNQKIYNKFTEIVNGTPNYIKFIITISLSVADYKNIFAMPLNDLTNYLFDLKITNDPVRETLNRKYEVVGIEFDGTLLHIKFIS